MEDKSFRPFELVLPLFWAFRKLRSIHRILCQVSPTLNSEPQQGQILSGKGFHLWASCPKYASTSRMWRSRDKESWSISKTTLGGRNRFRSCMKKALVCVIRDIAQWWKDTQNKEGSLQCKVKTSLFLCEGDGQRSWKRVLLLLHWPLK